MKVIPASRAIAKPALLVGRLAAHHEAADGAAAEAQRRHTQPGSPEHPQLHVNRVSGSLMPDGAGDRARSTPRACRPFDKPGLHREDRHLDSTVAPSFALMFATWTDTVFLLTYSTAPISALDLPAPRSARTSRSRRVRSDGWRAARWRQRAGFWRHARLRHPERAMHRPPRRARSGAGRELVNGLAQRHRSQPTGNDARASFSERAALARSRWASRVASASRMRAKPVLERHLLCRHQPPSRQVRIGTAFEARQRRLGFRRRGPSARSRSGRGPPHPHHRPQTRHERGAAGPRSASSTSVCRARASTARSASALIPAASAQMR